jgi:hypothetical protein
MLEIITLYSLTPTWFKTAHMFDLSKILEGKWKWRQVLKPSGHIRLCDSQAELRDYTWVTIQDFQVYYMFL